MIRLLLAIIFFIAGIVRVGLDWTATISQGDTFRMADVGTLWHNAHPDSLLAIEPAISRYLSQAVWDTVMLPFLTFPAALVFFALAILFWVFRKRRKRKGLFRK